MRVLVACEFSGIVRNAFLLRGHDAISCDLEPGWRKPYDRHVVGDVRPLLRQRWDLVIAHPPCTYLCHSGIRWLNDGGRRKKRLKGCEFFLECLDANSPKVCVENPVMLGGCLDLIGERPTQTVQPYEFGHCETKRTCLWLRGLPKLNPTTNLKGKTADLPKSVSQRMWWGGSRSSRTRSITYYGIARAMAEQWGVET